jgi:VWFA-related protein
MANVRVGGLMRMARRAAGFIEGLHPADRVAVLTYSSRLDLRLDFTNDRERLLDAVRVKAIFGPVGDPATDDEPSLLAAYDQQAALDAAVPEAGFKVLAEALEPIPGPKSVVFFGWGLGYRTRSHVRMRKQYGTVRSLFARSGTAIYALDVTEADWHTLEHGLRKAARETGGFYASTWHHPEVALNRLNHAISGYYLVTFAAPVDTVGYHKLRFRLTRANGLIYARDFFEN